MRLLIRDVDREFEVDVVAPTVWFFRGPPGWVPPRMPGTAQGVSLTCGSVTRPGHCALSLDGDTLVVRDLGSDNGTIVEREGLFHRVDSPIALERDDVVHLGRPTIQRVD